MKIPQLILGDLAQMDRHWDKNTKVIVWQVLFPLEENILLKLIYPLLHKNENTVNFFVITGNSNDTYNKLLFPSSTHTHTHTHSHTHIIHTLTHTYTHTPFTHTIHKHTPTHIHVHTLTHTHTHTLTHTHTHIHTSTHTHIQTHTHTDSHTHRLTHAHIHTQTKQ